MGQLITFESKGSFEKTDAFLKRMSRGDIFSALDHYGRQGVSALRGATPVESGLTAGSWTYEVVREKDTYSIIWGNTHIEDGRPIAILLQYGHGTGTGGYVQGRDYINPALMPIFEQIATEVWKVVTA